MFHSVLTDPSIRPEAVLPSHNTRRAGEIFPNVKTASRWGVRLLSSVGGVTILLANGSFRQVEPYVPHGVSAPVVAMHAEAVTDAVPDAATDAATVSVWTASAPVPVVARSSVDKAEVARTSAERGPVSGSVVVGKRSALRVSSPTRDRGLVSSTPMKPSVSANSVHFEMTIGFPKGSLGEQYVVGCLQRERRVAWSQLRSPILRFEGAQRLRLVSELADVPKGAIEQCLRGIALEVLMVPSVIEVRVK